MAARHREVIWAESAQAALDEVIAYIAKDSPDGARRVLSQALDAAASLSTLSERGRVVPELNNLQSAKCSSSGTGFSIRCARAPWSF